MAPHCRVWEPFHAPGGLSRSHAQAGDQQATRGGAAQETQDQQGMGGEYGAVGGVGVRLRPVAE